MTDPNQPQKPQQQPQYSDHEPMLGGYANQGFMPNGYAQQVPPHESLDRKKRNRNIFIVIGIAVLCFLLGVGLTAGLLYPQLNSRNSSLEQENGRLKSENSRMKTNLDDAQKKIDALTALNDYADGTSSEDESSSVDSGAVGDTLENTGMKLKLVSAQEQATISYDTCGDGCSNHQYAPKSPDANQKYWVATVEVTNTGKKPADMTCGYPIDINAINSDNQQFTPIKSLYQVEGNPECNAQLQPGTSENMVYVFQVPNEAHMIGLAFRGIDMDNLGSSTEYSYFITDSKYGVKE